VPVKTFLAEHQTRAAEFYPIVRARLTQINGHSTDGNKTKR
jgi:putative ABC transport system permease protein